MTRDGGARRSGWRFCTWPVLGLGLFWTLFPFYWMLTTALKPNDDMYRPEPLLVPVRVTWSHFHKVFFGSHFPEFFWNSTLVALATTVLSLVVGIFAAYAIVRLDFRGKNLIARSLIFSYLVPPVLLFIPLFEMIFRFGLLNTRSGLVLAYLTFTVPFTTWLLMGYFRTIPVALEEAALVDGCTRLAALFRIILPLSTPAIVVTAASEHIPPPLIRQLKDGGRMVIPVGSPFLVQTLMLVTKRGGEITTTQLMPVRFVPFRRGP